MKAAPHTGHIKKAFAFFADGEDEMEESDINRFCARIKSDGAAMMKAPLPNDEYQQMTAYITKNDTLNEEEFASVLGGIDKRVYLSEDDDGDDDDEGDLEG